jgi:hypothetical protein
MIAPKRTESEAGENGLTPIYTDDTDDTDFKDLNLHPGE